MSRYDTRNWTINDQIDQLLNVNIALYVKELEDAVLRNSVSYENADWYQRCRICDENGYDLVARDHKVTCLYRRIKEAREEKAIKEFFEAQHNGI